jgi:hypothetical protein
MKPTLEFFETLGQYVYKYVNDIGLTIYVGKGVGDRCLAHLKNKGYSIDNCYIVARNLEKFNDKPSLLLESFLIDHQKPADNIVSGHYKECFQMASLSSMFSDFTSDQHDNFESFPDWYVENYNSAFKGRVREIKINSGGMFVLSNARNSIYMMWYWSPSEEEEVKVTFETYGDDLKVEATKNKIIDWLSKNGYDDTYPDGKKQKLAITCENIEAVISLFKKFSS